MTDKDKRTDDSFDEALEDLGKSAARFMKKAFEKSEELLGAVGLDDLFGDLDVSEGKAPGARRKPKGEQKAKAQSPQREPAVDLFEEDDAVLIYVELPGADENSIKLSRQNGSLLVEARADRDMFSRQIDLPKGDWSAPKHHFKNGILKIELKQKVKKKSSGKK